MEAKKQNGEDYPAETLYELIISVHVYLEMQGKPMKFLNEDIYFTTEKYTEQLHETAFSFW